MSTAVKSETVAIAFVGDFALHGDFLTYLRRAGGDLSSPFALVSATLAKGDVRFCNFEALLDFDAAQARNDWILQSHPDTPRVLRGLGIDVASLANNHIMDCGIRCARKTEEALSRAGIHTVGLGAHREDAERAVFIERNGIRIGFLAFASPAHGVFSVVADATEPGCAPLPSQIDDHMEDVIRGVRAECDVLCISLHWGQEYYHFPSPMQVTMARRMIDLGASVVIGHHPHVLQGVERYREGVILYSLGNFFLSDFTLQNGERWTYPAAGKQFGIATVTASKEGVQRVSLSGGKVTRRFRMVPYGPVGRWRFSRWITRISEPLSRSDFPRFFRAYNGNVERALLWHGRVRDARVQWRSIRNHGLRAAIQYLLGSRRSLRLAVSAFSVLIREAFFRRTR